MTSGSGEVERLAPLFEAWGADSRQARTMAGQMLKRASQLAEEKDISRESALEYLLKVAAAGREGAVYEGPKPWDSEGGG